MSKKYVIDLSPAERAQLIDLLADAAAPVRQRRRARLLLDADAGAEDGGLNDQAIGLLRGVSAPTVARVRQLFVAGDSMPCWPCRRPVYAARWACNRNR